MGEAATRSRCTSVPIAIALAFAFTVPLPVEVPFSLPFREAQPMTPVERSLRRDLNALTRLG